MWGLRHGRARIWIMMLGEPRAVKLTRWFFGPLVGLIGIVLVLMALVTLFVPMPSKAPAAVPESAASAPDSSASSPEGSSSAPAQ